MKQGTSAIPQFHVILTVLSIFEIILIIQGHLQGQKVNFKAKWKEILILLWKLGTLVIPLFLYIFCHFEHIGKLFIKKNNRFSSSLTLFFYVYNVFLMFLIKKILRNSNPMSSSLKSLGIFLHSRSKVNFKVKYDFSTNEARNKCNTSIPCDFDWAIHFWNYFNYSRSSSRSKGQFQGQIKGDIIFTKKTCVIPLFLYILSILGNYSFKKIIALVRVQLCCVTYTMLFWSFL